MIRSASKATYWRARRAAAISDGGRRRCRCEDQLLLFHPSQRTTGDVLAGAAKPREKRSGGGEDVTEVISGCGGSALRAATTRFDVEILFSRVFPMEFPVKAFSFLFLSALSLRLFHLNLQISLDLETVQGVFFAQFL